MKQESTLADAPSKKRPRFGLSGRLLIWTIGFVMLSEVLIFVPSISNFRKMYLEERVAAAHLATLALKAKPGERIAPDLEQRLLDHAGVLAIELGRSEMALMLGEKTEADREFDLMNRSPSHLIREAFGTFYHRGERVICVVGPPPMDPDLTIEIFIDERPLYDEMLDYAWRILNLSIIISLITAGLVYLSLQWLLVRPMRAMTRNLVEFRQSPEDPSLVIAVGQRTDEVGVMQRELAHMEGQVRNYLAQKSRLAVLGTAVSKINHDLRNILSTAQMVSERLGRSEDPNVQRVTPLLADSVGRAVNLCTQTMDLARGDQAVLQRSRFSLADLMVDVAAALGLKEVPGIDWQIMAGAGLEIHADFDRLLRVFVNLGRNAVQAMEGRGKIRTAAMQVDDGLHIVFCDDGPGIPDSARDHLFEPFTGSTNTGGTGLGLVTARDLVRAHGGDLVLVSSDQTGTCFRIELPTDRPDDRDVEDQ